MKTIGQLKKAIMDKLWNSRHSPPMSDPEVHTYITEELTAFANEIIDACGIAEMQSHYIVPDKPMKEIEEVRKLLK